MPRHHDESNELEMRIMSRQTSFNYNMVMLPFGIALLPQCGVMAEKHQKILQIRDKVSIFATSSRRDRLRAVDGKQVSCGYLKIVAIDKCKR